MTNRFKPFKKEANSGDLCDRAMKIKTKGEARDYFERLVEFGMMWGQSREEAERISRSNLGYWSGYYSAKTASRVFRLFECFHPVFGTTRPDAKTAFKAGVALGKKSREREKA